MDTILLLKIILLVIAGLTVLFGLLLAIVPEKLINAEEKYTRLIDVLDFSILKHRYIWGVIFILCGFFLISISF